MFENHPQSAYFGPWRVKASHQRLDCTLQNGPSPSALRGAIATVEGGLASAFKPRLRLQQGPPFEMVLLMVADVLRLSQVTIQALPRQTRLVIPLYGA